MALERERSRRVAANGAEIATGFATTVGADGLIAAA
jgi:hypothetical protein